MEQPGRAGPAPPGRWRRAARGAWLVAVAVALVLVLVDRWEEVAGHLAGARPGLLAASTAAGVAAVGLSGAVWRSLLRGLGSSLPARAAAGIFFVGQLGKYLPGSVWPVLAQIELGRDHAVPARASFAAVALFMWVHFFTGVAVAALALPAAGLAPWPTALLAPAAVAVLAPGLLERAFSAVMRLTRRPPLAATPDGAAMVGSVAWAAAMWLGFGLHLVLAAAALGGGVPLVLAVGVFALAWCAGFAFVIAPAGAGVREAVIVAGLLPALPAGAALSVALLSRLLVVAGDVAWGLAGLGLRRRAALHRRGSLR